MLSPFFVSHLGASRYTPIQSSQDWVEKRVYNDRVFFNFYVLVITIYIPSVTEEKDNSDLRFQTGVSPSGADHPPQVGIEWKRLDQHQQLCFGRTGGGEGGALRRGLQRRDALKKTQGWDEKRQEREEKAADPEPSHLWQQLMLITCDRSTAAVKTHIEREAPLQ